MLGKLNKEKHKSVIVGMDHNIDFLKNDTNKDTQTFIESLLEHSYLLMITRLTRITKSTATLIDNIIVRQDWYSKSHSTIIIEDLSEHLPCIVISKGIKSLKGETVTITKRETKPDSLKQVNSTILSQNWVEKLCDKSASEQFELFHKVFIDTLDAYCLEKEMSVSNKGCIKEP